MSELRDVATFVAFSASGLKKLGLPSDEDGGLCGFASAFNIGMANRGRILGDRHDPNEPKWRWSDAGRGGWSRQRSERHRRWPTRS